MPKWEYKNLKYKLGSWESWKLEDADDLFDELNKLGSDGWELVDIFHYTNDGTLLEAHFILKRQVNE